MALSAAVPVNVVTVRPIISSAVIVTWKGTPEYLGDPMALHLKWCTPSSCDTLGPVWLVDKCPPISPELGLVSVTTRGSSASAPCTLERQQKQAKMAVSSKSSIDRFKVPSVEHSRLDRSKQAYPRLYEVLWRPATLFGV